MAPQTAMRRSGTMDRKLLRVSSKRQITIPQAFFTKLGLSDQVDCILHGNELILRPVKRDRADPLRPDRRGLLWGGTAAKVQGEAGTGTPRCGGDDRPGRGRCPGHRGV